MAYITNNEGVVNSFLNLQPANAGRLKTDGQSLFSYDLRIAEHVPQEDGTAITIVYDYTRGGNAYKSQTTSSHVGLIKRRVPKRNVVLVETAIHAGLIKA
jgi:hypothetical protein